MSLSSSGPLTPRLSRADGCLLIGIARDAVDETTHNVVWLDAFGFGVEVGDDAVPQYRWSYGAHVFAGDVIAAMQHGAGLGCKDEELCGTRAGSPRNVIADEIGHIDLSRFGTAGRWCTRLVGSDAAAFARQARELHGVADHVRRDRHLADDVLHFQNVRRRQDALDLWDVRRCRLLNDAELFLFVGIIDEDIEHEAVLLRFGQRIGAFLLDRVLRRQDEERIGQLVPRAADGDLAFLHRFEQSGLRLRRRAVDLVGEDDIGEQRAVQELEQTLACRLVFLQNLGAGDVRRHEVRRELDAAEAQTERVGQRADHKRFGKSRYTDKQTVATREDGDEQFFEDFFLTDDGFTQLLADAAITAVESFDGGQIAFDARPTFGWDGFEIR